MTTSTQFKTAQARDSARELLPMGLPDGVGLQSGEPAEQLAPRERLQQSRPFCGQRRQKHHRLQTRSRARQAVVPVAQVHFKFAHTTAAANDGRLPYRCGLGARDPSQGIGAYVHEVGNSCHAQRGGIDERAILGDEVHSIHQTLQTYRGLPRTTVSHEEGGVSANRHTRSVKRNQTLDTHGQRESCKLDDLVARVVRKVEHPHRHTDQSRPLRRTDRHEARRRGAATQQASAGEHLERLGLETRMGSLRGQDKQHDTKPRSLAAQTMPRQSLISGVDQAKQALVIAFESESRAQGIHRLTPEPLPVLEKRIGKQVREIQAR